MWLLKRDGETIGYYDTNAEAIVALIEESRKEDGVRLNVERERSAKDAAQEADIC